MSKTESILQKVHVFDTEELYESNKESIGTDDIVLVPTKEFPDVVPIAQGGTGVSNMVGTDYTTNRPRGIILQSSIPSSVQNGCIVGVYE